MTHPDAPARSSELHEEVWPFHACAYCGGIDRVPIWAERVEIYHDLLKRGLSDYEARGTAWPQGEYPPRNPQPSSDGLAQRVARLESLLVAWAEEADEGERAYYARNPAILHVGHTPATDDLLNEAHALLRAKDSPTADGGTT